MRLRRLKKFAPHIIILAALIGTTVPTLGAQLLKEFTPTLNLIDVLSKPEAVSLEAMEIVDKSYDKEAAELLISSNDKIYTNYPIWDIQGIYKPGEPYNYYTSTVFFNDKTIDLSRAPLRRTVENEIIQSQFVAIHENTFNITQSEDDAWNRHTTFPRMDYTSDTLLLGGHNLAGQDAQRRIALRWNATIPKDATLIEAYIYLTYATSNNYNGFRKRIYGFLNGSTPDFSDTSETLWGAGSRPKTSYLNWLTYQETGFVLPADNETIQTIDIKYILSQVINTPEWEGNYSFGVMIMPYQEVQNLNSEMVEYWSYDGAIAAGRPEFVPKLYVKWEEAPANNYSLSDFADSTITIERRLESTACALRGVEGVWNTSDHFGGNLYDESQGDSYTGDDITMIVRTPFENVTGVYVTYLTNEEIPVAVYYTVKDWTTLTWLLGLEFDNRGDETIIVPRANLTLNFLEETLGEGWIPKEYEIKGHSRKMVDAYLVMENDRETATFITAVLAGEPIEFKLGFEAYILAEDQNGEPMLPVVYTVELDFPFPSTTRGPFPFIHSITRSPVSPNQPVTISVNASDEGTGISNRTYLYYSINQGATWDRVDMTGGTWWGSYLGTPLGGYFPIPSTTGEEKFEGEIPASANKPGREILFKVYIEDYADDVDHEGKGNWIWSQVYSYVVPGAGELPAETKTFQKSTEKAFFSKFLDFIELNGLILSHFLFLRGITTDALIPLLPSMGEFFYDNDIDSSYILAMIIVHFDFGVDIMSDSGVSVGYLLELFGVDFQDIFEYLIDHAFLPLDLRPDQSLHTVASDYFEEITLVDTLTTYTIPLWNSTANGTVQEETSNVLNINGEKIGSASLNWALSGPAILSSNYSLLTQLFGPIDLSKNHLIDFYIDYDNYTRLNGNLAMTLIDGNNRTMTSSQISFGETASGTFQEINIPLSEFTQEPGFNIADIHNITFTYSGNEAVNVYIDYISAYSTRAYNYHVYFTNTIAIRNNAATNSFKAFLNNIFQGMGANLNPMARSWDPIIPDWGSIGYPSAIVTVPGDRMPSYNFVHLLSTNGTYNYIDGPGPNHHMVAAELLLEYVGVADPYRTMCSMFGIEIEPPPDAFTKAEIYPYTNNLGKYMVYIPFAGVAALAIVLQTRRYLSKKKGIGIREKYKKIIKR
ncbi:MAG: hypothetical protein ACFE8A_12195 [Candidatus Hodarchaeota archaeon]